MMGVLVVVLVSGASFERCTAESAGCEDLKQQSTPSLMSASSIRPTALTGEALDASVLERLIRQRLSAVLRESIKASLKTALGDKSVPNAVADFLEALVPLFANTTDAETRAQSLSRALLRLGLSSAMASAQGATEGCDMGQRLDAAYEVLAQMPSLRALGFTHATGRVHSVCSTFANEVEGRLQVVTAYAIKPEDLTAIVTMLETLRGRGDECRALTSNLESTAELLSFIERAADAEVAEKCPAALLVVEEIQRRWGRTPESLGLLQPGLKLADMQTSLDEAQKKVANPEIIQLAFRVARKEPISRAELVPLVQKLTEVVESALKDTKWQPTEGGSRFGSCGEVASVVVGTFLHAIPELLRDTHEGAHLDLAALITEGLERAASFDRPGVYVRATVGTGLLMYLDKYGPAVPTLHEELGVGYRIKLTENLMLGAHGALSGLLYKLTLNGTASNGFALFGGLSLNVYRLLEFGVNFGALILPNGAAHPTAQFSVQLPLADYVTEVTQSREVESSKP